MIQNSMNSVIKSNCKYVAINQQENTDQPCTSYSEAQLTQTTSVAYHEMNELDPEAYQDNSSTADLNDFQASLNVGFWSRSRQKYGHHQLRYFLLSFCQRKYTRLEITLGGIVVLLSVVIAVSISLLLKPDAVCTSRACIQISSAIANALDESVNPCDDFYEFSCGKWKTIHPLPAGHARWDMFNIQSESIKLQLKSLLEEKVANNSKESSEWKSKALYKSCLNLTLLNELGGKPVNDLINKVGGWSINGPWKESNFELNKILKSVFPLGISPFVSVSVNSDLFNVDRHIISVGEGAISLGSRKYYVNKTMDDKILSAYHQYMVKVCILLGGESNYSANAMRDVLLFEQKLAYIKMPAEKARNMDKYYKHLNISQLQSLSKEIQWLDFLDTMFKEEKINASEIIGTMSSAYLHSLTDVIQSTPPEILNNYIMWHVVATYVKNLGEDFIAARNKVLKVIYGSDLSCVERWRTCVSVVDSALGLASGKLFVENNFNKESKTQAELMVNHIKDAFKRNLPKTSWMDDTTREKAREKADAVQDMIGFQDEILNQTEVDLEYKDLDLSGKETYFDMMSAVYSSSWKESLEDLRKPVDKTEWEMTPPTINAYYSPPKNTIVFPAGILQPPVYSKAFPMSINFGGIGLVVGHELTHGFDDQGRKYDKDGQLRNWWAKETADNFHQRAACMVKQYSNYTLRDQKVNGNLTLGENIADNGGLRLAYDAYTKWRETGNVAKDDPLLPSLPYSHKQLFFIAFAQLWCSVSTPQYDKRSLMTNVHSPFKIRVMGTLSNSVEFAEAFQCPIGSPMNPTNKCSVW